MISDKFFDDVNHRFSLISLSPGLDPTTFLDACFRLCDVFKYMSKSSFNSSRAEDDVRRNLNSIQLAVNRNPGKTIDEIVKAEFFETNPDRKTWKKDRTAIISLLWINRTLQYLFVFFGKFLQNPRVDNATMTKYIEESYAATLRPYHGMVVRKAFDLFFVFNRNNPNIHALVHQQMQTRPEAFLKDLTDFCSSGKPLCHHIRELYKSLKYTGKRGATCVYDVDQQEKKPNK